MASSAVAPTACPISNGRPEHQGRVEAGNNGEQGRDEPTGEEGGGSSGNFIVVGYCCLSCNFSGDHRGVSAPMARGTQRGCVRDGVRAIQRCRRLQATPGRRVSQLWRVLGIRRDDGMNRNRCLRGRWPLLGGGNACHQGRRVWSPEPGVPNERAEVTGMCGCSPCCSFRGIRARGDAGNVNGCGATPGVWGDAATLNGISHVGQQRKSRTNEAARTRSAVNLRFFAGFLRGESAAVGVLPRPRPESGYPACGRAR